MAHEAIINVEEVSKSFYIGNNKTTESVADVLKGVSLKIDSGDFVIIYGPSGCGKSTLLNTIIGLQKPDKGKVTVRDKNIYNMIPNELAKFRNSKFGVIHQQPLWIKALTLLDNVAMPLLIKGESLKNSRARAATQLREFGLHKHLYHKPVELSGGQQQKAAAARALIYNPWIVVADEPTGNLDTHSADEMMSLFHDLNKEKKHTIIMVTHNLIYLPMANKKVAMIDGKITTEESEVQAKIKTEFNNVMEGIK